MSKMPARTEDRFMLAIDGSDLVPDGPLEIIVSVAVCHFEDDDERDDGKQAIANSDYNNNLGMEFKSLHLLKTPFPISKNALSWGSNASFGKGSYIISPKQSTSKTLDLLDAYEDEYGGMVIDPECLPSSANAFVAVLRASIAHWKIKGKKGIWLKILVEQANLVPIAMKEGFIYHHAEPGYVMLTYWIPDEPCILPASATHQVGIAGFVINEKREVISSVDKYSVLAMLSLGTSSHFIHLYVQSEELFVGAVREVKEETGIDTAFVEVTAFRHAHLVAFEKSDLLFICMLRPLSFDISIDESEIEAAKWMPLDEVLAQPFYQEDCMSRKAIEVCVARYENRYHGLTAHQLISKLDGKLSYLYYNE
ncbi:nudix (nucleoside diphosphate linked moiety X)-type motif 8 [Asimina triloba]